MRHTHTHRSATMSVSTLDRLIPCQDGPNKNNVHRDLYLFSMRSKGTLIHSGQYTSREIHLTGTLPNNLSSFHGLFNDRTSRPCPHGPYTLQVFYITDVPKDIHGTLIIHFKNDDTLICEEITIPKREGDDIYSLVREKQIVKDIKKKISDILLARKSL